MQITDPLLAALDKSIKLFAIVERDYRDRDAKGVGTVRELSTAVALERERLQSLSPRVTAEYAESVRRLSKRIEGATTRCDTEELRRHLRWVSNTLRFTLIDLGAQPIGPKGEWHFTANRPWIGSA